MQRVAEPRRLPFRVTAWLDSQIYTTSNVFLSADGAVDAGENATVSATTVFLKAEVLPIAVGRTLLTPSVGFSYQRYLHGLGGDKPAIEDLDFDSYSLPIALNCRFGRGWEASASYVVGSLYSVRGAPDYELIYRSRTAALGLRKLSELGKNTVIIAGAGVSYSDTWTSLRDVPATLGYRDDRNDKLEAALDLSLYRFVGAWTFAPYARLAWSDYTHWQEGAFTDYDRRDLTVGGGLSVSYAFAPWGSVRVFGGYDLRDSNLDGGSGPDYTYGAGTLGGGVSVRLQY